MSGPASSRSLWFATFDPSGRRYEHGLVGGVDVDVAIVGGGYTGLWTALALAEADPMLRIAVLESRSVGFGASGRNGGWCSALIPIGLGELVRRHGRERAVAWQRAMFDTVGVVGEFAARSAATGIDPQYHRGGTVTFAGNPAQRQRLVRAVEEARELGFGDDDLAPLDEAATARRCRADGILAATYTPHCAVVQPLRLVHAIAAAAAAAGVRVVEGVDVVEVEPGRLTTTAGTVTAETIVLATEAYTVALPRRHRDVLPIYSLMIGTGPLTDAQWDAVGLGDRETFTSAGHLVIYGQRTADGRLAFGGRGAPYHFGSRIATRFDTDERVRAALVDTVTTLFPVLAGAEFPYHWGGPLAVPRDWHPHVGYDATTGLAAAGGYVGDGVAAANLAGRTLADLILRRDTELTRLPWVGHRSRRWEPEPLRWLGVRLAALAEERADLAEESAGRPAAFRAAAWTKLIDVLGGR